MPCVARHPDLPAKLALAPNSEERGASLSIHGCCFQYTLGSESAQSGSMLGDRMLGHASPVQRALLLGESGLEIMLKVFGAYRGRTGDLFNAIEARYQLR